MTPALYSSRAGFKKKKSREFPSALRAIRNYKERFSAGANMGRGLLGRLLHQNSLIKE